MEDKFVYIMIKLMIQWSEQEIRVYIQGVREASTPKHYATGRAMHYFRVNPFLRLANQNQAVTSVTKPYSTHTSTTLACLCQLQQEQKHCLDLLREFTQMSGLLIFKNV